MDRDEIIAQIAILNKADLAFRLAEWHIQQAQTDSERRQYARASLVAATQRSLLFAWLEQRRVILARQYGEFVQCKIFL